MNKIWIVILILSISMLTFSSPQLALPCMLEASGSAISLSIELLAIYALWLGIINIVENTPIKNLLSKILSPLIDWLWGKDINKNAKNYLSLSLSTSLLGIGGASVPLGIKAIEEMDDKSGVVSFPMIMTIVFASSGVQLLPTTVMSLMTTMGSTTASFIILPTLLAGLSTTIVGVTLAKIINKFDKAHKKG